MASPLVRCDAVISLNKYQYEDPETWHFISELTREFANAGVDLFDCDDRFVTGKPNIDERLPLIAIVVLTKEYVDCPICLEQFVTIWSQKIRICPIIYGDGVFGTRDYFEFYTKRAKKTIDAFELTVDKQLVKSAFRCTFFSFDWWPQVETAFLHPGTDRDTYIRDYVRKTVILMNPALLDVQRGDMGVNQPHLQRICAPIVEDNDHIFYIGISGPDASCNTWIAKWFGNIFHSLTLVGKYFPHVPNDDLRSWGMHLLYMVAYNLYRDSCSDLGDVITCLSSGPMSSLIILDGLDTCDQFQELYNVLTYLGERTRIIFTTRNENIFSSSNFNWECNQLDQNNPQRIFTLKPSVSKVDRVREELELMSDSVMLSDDKLEQIDPLHFWTRWQEYDRGHTGAFEIGYEITALLKASESEATGSTTSGC